MNAPWDIKGEDISQWADRYEAAAMLPELVRRLLLANGVVQSLDMRADSGVRLGGWDGLVVAHRASPFCPLGLSVWELSVQEQIQKKLDKDFDKRSKSPVPTRDEFLQPSRLPLSAGGNLASATNEPLGIKRPQRPSPMRLNRTVMLSMLLVICTTTAESDGAVPPSVTKKELPWLEVPGGRMKTTLFYGPWQCRKEFMRLCQQECTQEGHRLMGCMWLADIKLDWEGSLIIPPLPIKAGSRYGVFHCCCDYSELTAQETLSARKKWENKRSTFRKEWSKKFGEWPVEGGNSWPGHHLRDIYHGGDPVDPNNIIPAQPDVHEVFNDQYPVCYAGKAPWNAAGPDLPYTDN